MKRRAIFKLLLFLLGGAVINVAVAWTCGWASMYDLDKTLYGTSTRDRIPPVGMPVHIWRSRGFGVEKLHVMASGSSEFEFGDHYRPLEEVRPGWVSLENDLRFSALSEGASEADALAQGWPLLALWCECPEYQRIEGGLLLSQVQVGQSFLVVERVVAFRPIWRGLAVNTVFYAAILWILFATPRAIRRKLRRRRGLCATCGYSLRESVSEKCPECGAVARAGNAVGQPPSSSLRSSDALSADD